MVKLTDYHITYLLFGRLILPFGLPRYTKLKRLEKRKQKKRATIKASITVISNYLRILVLLKHKGFVKSSIEVVPKVRLRLKL